ncbi:prothymosin alpha-like [Otolemur garnettii]|uniref:prothymosin alpha-like n=1 Tax=Otolemur garnettii TaxID=30611 RepID=UPI0006441152|nr:prothymosin alpha-like [Otolemur garnettii]
MSDAAVDTSSKITTGDLKEEKEDVDEAENGRDTPADGNANEENGEQEADNEVEEGEDEGGEEEEEGDSGEEDRDEDEEAEATMGRPASEDEDDDVDTKKQKTDEDDQTAKEEKGKPMAILEDSSWVPDLKGAYGMRKDREKQTAQLAVDWPEVRLGAELATSAAFTVKKLAGVMGTQKDNCSLKA